MNRRDAIAALIGLGLTGRSRASPPAGRTPARIGLLPKMWDFQVALLRDALLERGWREGADYTLLRADLPGDRIEEAAQAIVATRPDVIWVANTGYALAAHRRTKTIPIVMFVTGFPVEAGLAESLARPGKNVTGNAGYTGAGLFGKLFELLREAKPDLKKLGVLWAYVPPAHPVAEVEPCYREMREAAERMRLDVQIQEIARTEHLPPALEALRSWGVDGLFITSGPGTWDEAKRLMRFATEYQLPTIADWPWSSDLYPLLTYSPAWRELVWQSAAYIDRILMGEKPGMLPLQQPSKYELVVNAKTAQAIGITLPTTLLLRADRVIE